MFEGLLSENVNNRYQLCILAPTKTCSLWYHRTTKNWINTEIIFSPTTHLETGIHSLLREFRSKYQHKGRVSRFMYAWTSSYYHIHLKEKSSREFRSKSKNKIRFLCFVSVTYLNASNIRKFAIWTLLFLVTNVSLQNLHTFAICNYLLPFDSQLVRARAPHYVPLDFSLSHLGDHTSLILNNQERKTLLNLWREAIVTSEEQFELYSISINIDENMTNIKQWDEYFHLIR